PHVLSTLGPTRIAFRLNVCQPIRHGHHGIALSDADRRLMWAFSTDDLSLHPGTIRLCYDFPFMPLRPGPYSWQVSLLDDEGNVDLWDAVPEMLIATENYQHARDEWNGALNLPCRFAVAEP